MSKPLDFGDRLKALESEEGKGADRWPSREPSNIQIKPQELPQGQITMRGRQIVIDRFRDACQADRRTYIDMLEILLNDYVSRE